MQTVRGYIIDTKLDSIAGALTVCACCRAGLLDLLRNLFMCMKKFRTRPC